MTYDLIPFKRYIEKKAGIIINDHEKLCFAIDEMIALKSLKSEKDLLRLIINKRDEFENLVGFLTINETYFFREASQLKMFSGKLIPLLISQKKTGKINILSAGCSTGAEPYSLVIELIERFGRNIGHLFSVYGFDIDKKALKIADKGIYGKYYFRGVEQRIIDKYFDKTADDKYKIKSFVRERVNFFSHNLLHAPFPEIFHDTHVIFYRNVSIYFNPENQKKIFINLSDILSKNGYLVMSSTETFPHDFQIMSLIKLGGSFLYQKKAPHSFVQEIQAETDKVPYVFKLTKKPGGDVIIPKTKEIFKRNTQSFTMPCEREGKDKDIRSPDSQIQKAWSLAQNKRHTESLTIIDNLIDRSSEPARAYTLKASVLINLNKLAEAKKACLDALETDEFRMESFFLLGVIAKFENNPEESEEQFKKAIYLDSSCWLAHYHLAEIYRFRNEIEKSFRKYEIVIKLIEKSKKRDSGLEFYALPFSEKELIHACRRIIEKLKTE